MVTLETMIPTEAILGSPLKVRILRLLARYPGREFTLRELARLVGASHVGVGKALEDLLAYAIVRRRVIGRAYAVSANPDSVSFRGASKLFDTERTALNRLGTLVRRWCSRHPSVLYAALFGSYARALAGPRSDVDLLLVARNPKRLHEDLGPLQEAVHKLLGRPLAPLLMSPTEFARLRESALARAVREEGTTLYQRDGWALP